MTEQVASKLPDVAPEVANAEEETDEHRAKEEHEEKLNFFMLLHELDRAETKGVPLAELEAIDAKVKAKVDGIFSRMTRLEAEEARLSAIQTEFGKAKAIVQNKQKRLREWAQYCMVYFKRDRLNGEKFTFGVSRVDGGIVVAGDVQPTAVDAMLFPDFVETTRTWRKKEATTAIKNGVKVPECLSIGKTTKFSTNVRKKEK